MINNRIQQLEDFLDKKEVFPNFLEQVFCWENISSCRKQSFNICGCWRWCEVFFCYLSQRSLNFDICIFFIVFPKPKRLKSHSTIQKIIQRFFCHFERCIWSCLSFRLLNTFDIMCEKDGFFSLSPDRIWVIGANSSSRDSKLSIWGMTMCLEFCKAAWDWKKYHLYLESSRLTTD